jgi:hypothetical protein
MKNFHEWCNDKLVNEGKKKNKWIQKAVKHLGRCEDKRFKKKGDLYAGD